MAIRPLPVLALGIAGILLAGCANGGAQNAPDDDQAWYGGESDLAGGLEIVGFGLGDEIATVRHELALERLGSVDVSLVEGAFDIQQFLSAVAANDAPDLIYAGRDEIGSLAARGAVEPLDQCFEQADAPVDRYRESAIDQLTLGGSVYGVPEFNVVQMAMANADLLEQAGLTIDDVNGSDWDAMASAADAMLDRSGDGITTIGVDSKLPEFFPLWAVANGASLISEDGRTAELDAPEAVEALEFAVDVYERQGGFPAVKAARDSADFFGEGNQFATDSLGAMPMEQWYLNVLADVSPDAPLAFDAMRTPAGEPLAFASGQAWAVPTGSENRAAACVYALAMTETDAWVAAAEERAAQREADGEVFTGVLTANVEADERIRELVPETDGPWNDGVDAMYEANENTFSLPASPAAAEFTRIWTDAVNRVLTTGADPAEQLAAAQRDAQSALDDAWADFDREQG